MRMRLLFSILLLALCVLPIAAHDGEMHTGEPIVGDDTADVAPEFDIVFAQVTQLGSNLYFHMVVNGQQPHA